MACTYYASPGREPRAPSGKTATAWIWTRSAGAWDRPCRTQGGGSSRTSPGVTPADIARTTEEISAFLTGESAELPHDLPNRQTALDALTETLQAAAANPTFVRVFG